MIIRVFIILLLAIGITGGIVIFRNSQPLNQKLPTSSKNTFYSPTEALPTSRICEVAQNVTEGPYYISGTAKLENNALNYTHLAGRPIKISGFVYAGVDNSNPVPNAKIELWEADSNGQYHPNSNGDASDYKADELALRGYILSDTNGYYEFTALYPGYYEGRARHIHVKVSAEDLNVLITQLIFMPEKGDGVDLSNDAIAPSLPECNLLQLTRSKDFEVGVYDFRLR